MGRTLQIQTARVFEPLLGPARYKGAWGGRGSAKSHFFAENLIDDCVRFAPLRAACIREVQKSLEQSVKRLLEDKIKKFNLGREFKVMNTHIETPGDGIIIFQGMQNHTAESIKSLEGFHRAWVEEAQSLSERSLTLLRPTIREPGSEIWMSWNPHLPTDPVDVLLRGPNPPPDAIVVRSNFEDNPWFPDVLKAEMEWDRAHDYEKYEHVWGGGYEKHASSRVFKNWHVEEFETPLSTVFYFGGDWGYSIDPTVLVRLWVDDSPRYPGKKRLNIDAEVYKIGCEIDDTPALFDSLGCTLPHFHEVGGRYGQDGPCEGMARPWVITADSARPETISYLRRHGYSRIEPAIKGPNSVKEGVIFLQGYDIRIHPRCKHTRDEFTHYNYVVDKLTGIVTPVLEDKKNHVIDSVRYAVEKLRAGVASMVTLAGYRN
jgi:phage terminase large subunit